MWCRFLTFCVLVSFILFVVASCIYGRPSFHLFFHRCCGDDIENDQVIYENFGNNFLKERLVGGDIIEADNDTIIENEDFGRIPDELKEVLSINDPEVKKWIADTHISDSDVLDTVTEDEMTIEHNYGAVKEQDGKLNYETLQKETDVTATASSVPDEVTEDKEAVEKDYKVIKDHKKEEESKVDYRLYKLLKQDAENRTKAERDRKEIIERDFINVRNNKHRQIARTI